MSNLLRRMRRFFSLPPLWLMMMSLGLISCANRLPWVPPPEDPPDEEPVTAPVFPPTLVAGSVEWVKIEQTGQRLEARMDTGAVSSSLHAVDVVRFERDGDRWVRFRTLDPKTGENTLELERPLSRNVRILQHADDPDRRPVVLFRARVGDVEREVEFTLADRTHFQFPVLIGRNFLADHLLVDSARTHLLGKPE